MKQLISVLLLTLSGAMAFAQAEEEQELTQFIDSFFSEFAALSGKMWSEQKQGRDANMMDLVHLTQKHFVRPSEESIQETGSVASVDIIAGLWPIMPEAWEIEDLRVAGDVARAKISFMPSRGPSKEPVPYDMRFIRSGGQWLFLRIKDLRPKKEAEPVELRQVQSAMVTTSASETLASFLDYLVANRDAVDIRNPAKLRPAVELITDSVAELWQKSPAGNRARNEAIAKLLMQDMEAWSIKESSRPDEASWQAIVEITMGERNPMAAYMKVKPKVTFKSARNGDAWVLTEFQIAR